MYQQFSKQIIPEQVQWHEGMLLTPHHFQQMAARTDALQTYNIQRVQPFAWGIYHILLDNSSLVSGVFRVLELECIMPDGLYVRYPASENDEQVLMLDLRGYENALRQSPMKIYIAVNKPIQGVAVGANNRFSSVSSEPVADINTGDIGMPIPRLRPRLQLLIGEPSAAHYTLMPLAEVQLQFESYKTTQFIPPFFHTTSSTDIAAEVRSIAQLLREKALTLSNLLSAPTVSEDSSLLTTIRQNISLLTTGLPRLEALLAAQNTHPFTLYLALCDIAGLVSPLHQGVVPPLFPPYDHNNMREAYREVLAFINTAVRTGITDSHDSYAFLYSGGVFTLSFRPEWIGKSVFIMVRGARGSTETDIRRWVETSIIGAQPLCQSMRDRRILGVSRKSVERDGQLTPPRGSLLYALTYSPEYIQPEIPLEVSNLSEKMNTGDPAEILLFVRKE